MSATSVFRPVWGLWTRIWPVRALCRTRPSGSTAKLIGSPGRSFSVTFWKGEVGNSWAAATDGSAKDAHRATSSLAAVRIMGSLPPVAFSSVHAAVTHYSASDQGPVDFWREGSRTLSHSSAGARPRDLVLEARARPVDFHFLGSGGSQGLH